MSNGRYSASVDQLSQHLLPSAARRRDQPSTGSPALRYWNLAQQRHYRRSAPCRRAMPVSGDCAARHGPHTRGKRPGFRPRQANSRERRTVCWREMDSNHRYPAKFFWPTVGAGSRWAWPVGSRRSPGPSCSWPPSWRSRETAAIEFRCRGTPRDGRSRPTTSVSGKCRISCGIVFPTSGSADRPPDGSVRQGGSTPGTAAVRRAL
jgi:hypothetical protein